MTNISRPIMAAATTLLLTGCIGLSFNTEELTTNRHITVGQELMDLHAAHEKGIIDEAEYKAARQEILKRNSKPEQNEAEGLEKKEDQQE